MRRVRWVEARGWRRLTVCLCFLEGVHHPDQPAAFLMGLHNARPGSWLERVFAWEVFRFDNAQHCLEALRVLRRHGVNPRLHRNPEIARALLALDREIRPESGMLPLPSAENPASLKRNPGIRLFGGAVPTVSGADAKASSTHELEPPA